MGFRCRQIVNIISFLKNILLQLNFFGSNNNIQNMFGLLNMSELKFDNFQIINETTSK